MSRVWFSRGGERPLRLPDVDLRDPPRAPNRAPTSVVPPPPRLEDLARKMAAQGAHLPASVQRLILPEEAEIETAVVPLSLQRTLPRIPRFEVRRLPPPAPRPIPVEPLPLRPPPMPAPAPRVAQPAPPIVASPVATLILAVGLAAMVVGCSALTGAGIAVVWLLHVQ